MSVHNINIIRYNIQYNKWQLYGRGFRYKPSPATLCIMYTSSCLSVKTTVVSAGREAFCNADSYKSLYTRITLLIIHTAVSICTFAGVFREIQSRREITRSSVNTTWTDHRSGHDGETQSESPAVDSAVPNLFSKRTQCLSTKRESETH